MERVFQSSGDNQAPADRQKPSVGQPAQGVEVITGFVLLFAVPLEHEFSGFEARPPGVEELATERADAWISAWHETAAHVLGKAFIEARRFKRWPLGLIKLGGMPEDQQLPTNAEVHLLTHASGVALWEVWLPGLEQTFDADRWIDWLDPQSETGVAASLWRVIGPISEHLAGRPDYLQCFPVSIMRAPYDSLATVLKQHTQDVVRLLLLDRASRPFKPEFVQEVLSGDYCAREGGLTLLSRRSGLDFHGNEDAIESKITDSLPPRSALPFLITLEILVVERTVLLGLYDRLSRAASLSIEGLLALKQEALDGLEEYYGAITAATRFSDAVAADGERLLGIGELYDAVTDRLEAVSFAITTRYQKHMTVMGFWLTVVFGASEIGFIASGIATWYYNEGLALVLAWTIGGILFSALALVALLWRRVK
jgi:hypothetical protein